MTCRKFQSLRHAAVYGLRWTCVRDVLGRGRWDGGTVACDVHADFSCGVVAVSCVVVVRLLIAMVWLFVPLSL